MSIRHLSALDAAFLAMETSTSTGHTASWSVLDPSTAPEELTLERVSAMLESRLHLVPVMRQRLMHVPLGIDQPVWVDDEHFDIGYHVRELALPSPGSPAQLAEQLSRIHARPLDRSRPLWETYLISGLGDGTIGGGTVGVYTKVHHAVIDGASGAELLTVLFDLTPEGRPDEAAEPFVPRQPPSSLGLGARAVGRLARRPWDVTRVAVDSARALPALGPVIGTALGRGREEGKVLAPATRLTAPQTPLNVSISPHRRFAAISLSLPDVKHVKNTFGVSVNDVVLSICAGALRSWLEAHDALPDAPLVAMVPVSVRTSKPDFEGNQVSAMLADLPTNVADPAARLEVAHRATQVAKAQQAAIPQGLVDEVTEFAVPALTGRVARVWFASTVMNRLPAFNVVISNVPGPNIPIYFAGARLLAHYPLSAITNGLALNITVVGYADGLHFGLVGAREVLPDLDDIATELGVELDALVAAADAASAAGKPQRTPRTRS